MAWRFWFRDGVGGCPGCMGWACRLAIASWLCFAATILLTSNVSMVCVSGAFVFVATALWLCHLGAFVGKQMAQVAELATAEPNCSRRSWLGAAWRIAMLGVATSLFKGRIAWAGINSCGDLGIVLVVSPVESCAPDLAEAFRESYLALRNQADSVADSLCRNRQAGCPRGHCRRAGARNVENIVPFIRRAVGLRGRLLWCCRCQGMVRVICRCSS